MKTSTLKSVLAISASLAPVVFSSEATPDQYCGYSCLNTLDAFPFTSTDPIAGYYVNICADKLRVASIVLCLHQYCNKDEITAGMEVWGEECRDDAGLPGPVYDEVLTPENLAFLNDESNFFGYENLKNWTATLYPVPNPVVPNQDLFALADKTISVWFKGNSNHKAYGAGMVGYWAFVISVGICFRIASWVAYRLSLRTSQDPEAHIAKSRGTFKGKIAALYRCHVGLPAMFGMSHQHAKGWYTVPTRLQSILLWVFFILNFIACACSYYTFDNNIYWARKNVQIWRYVSDRTGTVAYYNMPLIFLFAVRNNVFLWLTGWSFATYNQFHRWVARITLIEAIVHSVGYTVQIYLEGGAAVYKSYYKDGNWFYTGVMATVFMSFMVLLSLYWLRSRVYEVFLRLHIALSVGVLVTLFYHTMIFDKEYDPYLWACVAVWALDRLVSGGRLLFLNYKALFGGHRRARVEYHEDQDILRINVHPSFHLKPQPGTYYFMYFPTMWRGWGSHPFTLASWTGSEVVRSASSLGAGSPTYSSLEREGKEINTCLDTSSPTASDYAGEPRSASPGDMTLSFMVKPFDGFTGRLMRKVAAAGNTKDMSILIEGPYGLKHHLHRYENLVLIAGGSGVTAIIPYLHSLLNDKIGIGSAGVRTKRIHLVFSSRKPAFVKEVLATEMSQATRRPEVSIALAVTRSGDKAADDDFLAHMVQHKSVTMQFERFNIDEAIREQVYSSKLATQEDSGLAETCVFICGPARMADRARRTVVDIIGSEKSNRVHFFEEHFGW